MQKLDLNVKGFIPDQKHFDDIPYGSQSSVARSGCGSIACYHYLLHHGYDINYIDAYKYFNNDKNLYLGGRGGTSPFAIKRYLKKEFGLKVKMHFLKTPKKELDSLILLYVFKKNDETNAHYMFGYKKNGKFITHNLNREHENLSECIKSENTVGRWFIVYEISPKK